MRVALTLEQCWHRVPGGTAVAALELVAALQAARPEPGLVAADAAEPAGVEAVGVAAWHRHGPAAEFVPPVAVRHLPLPRAALYEAWHRLRRPAVQRATGPVDVIHATTLIVPPRSAPLVVTVHDLAFVHEPQDFTARGLRFFHRGLELIARDADLVLCSSEATVRDAAAHGLPAERLRLVPLGVHAVPAAPADVARVRRQYGLTRPYVLSVGTQEPRKNLARLVAAFEGFDPGYDLAVVGPAGWGEQPPAGAARAKVLGFVPADDLRALYAGAGVFAYPSRREGFGLPVLEAMAQGAPVVTSRGTATEEAAGGAAVLVDPLDVDDIRGGLDEALGRRDELAVAGRARAAECTWARTAALTVAAYAEASGR